MKSIKSLFLLMAAIILTACNNGGTSPNTSSNIPPISYAINESGEIYLNAGGNGIWTKVDAALPTGTMYALTCGVHTCVSASDSGLSVSDNLTTWSPVSQSNSKSAPQMTKALYDVIVTDFVDGNDLVVGVGQGGSIVTTSTTLAAKKATSTNHPSSSLMATAVNSGTTNDLYQTVFDSIRNQWLAIGQSGTLLQSTDGLNWALKDLGESSHFYAIQCGNTFQDAGCTIVGQDGLIENSADGITWTKEDSPTANTLLAFTSNAVSSIESSPESDATMIDATPNATIYVAVGINTAVYSKDRVHWSLANFPAQIVNYTSYGLYNVVFTGTQFIANIVVSDGALSDAVLVSNDGINWNLFVGGEPYPAPANTPSNHTYIGLTVVSSLVTTPLNMIPGGSAITGMIIPLAQGYLSDQQIEAPFVTAWDKTVGSKVGQAAIAGSISIANTIKNGATSVVNKVGDWFKSF